MTDEELAEKYRKDFERTFLKVDLPDIEDAYLAGLKAGKSKWHDLRKDPTDLPNKSNPISSNAVLDQNGDRCWYNFKDRQWENANCRTDGTYDCKVIAWCEIPTFTNKETK